MSLPYYTLNTTKMNEVRKSPIVMRGQRNFINGDVQYDKYSLLILCLFYNNPVCQAEICCDKEDLTEIEFLFKYGKSKNDVFLGDDVFSVDRDSMPLTIEEFNKKYVASKEEVFNGTNKILSTKISYETDMSLCDFFEDGIYLEEF